MANTVDLKEFVTGFILEADEHLHSVNQNLVSVSEALKRNRPDPRAIRELFRSLHTIKGLASMVGAVPIVDISHEMESILRTADRAGGRISEASLDLILRGTRAIEERVSAIPKVGVTSLPKAPASLIEALSAAQDQLQKSAGLSSAELSGPADILKTLSPSDREQVTQALELKKRAVLIEFRPSQEKSGQGLNITSVRERLTKLGELVKVIPRSSTVAPTGIAFVLLLVTNEENLKIFESVGVSDDLIEDLRLNVTKGPDAEFVESFEPQFEEDLSPLDQTSIRVEIRKLDETLERLSELVVTRSKLARAAADLRESGSDTRALDAVIAENSRQLRRLRAAITEARMVPLSELLQRLPLIVRGITKDSTKAVNMNIRAGNAEVDKAVADKIMPAIVHLIRNSVDHAIETKEERRKNNRPEAGTIRVECDDTSGTHLVLTISDDGKGIDREAVAKKAGRSVAQNNEELLKQITMPGLSTQDKVTQTSGRGMGMDIVKRTVDVLGGSLKLNSTVDHGTTFTIKVPVSVTIVDVMSFISGGQVFVAPVAVIDEILEVNEAKLRTAPVPSQQGVQPKLLERRGEAIPLLNLGDLINAKNLSEAPKKALIVRLEQGLIAYGVDRMLGRQEVVVRPLDDSLVRVNGMAGATDMGDGRPTLVLDLINLGAGIYHDSQITE